MRPRGGAPTPPQGPGGGTAMPTPRNALAPEDRTTRTRPRGGKPKDSQVPVRVPGAPITDIVTWVTGRFGPSRAA